MIQPQCASISDTIVYAIDTLQGAAHRQGNLSGFRRPNTVATRLGRPHPAPADPYHSFSINAVKFTPSDGTVKVQVRSLEENPNHLLLEVSDSGPGISPDKTELIFERLFQASDPRFGRPRGSGSRALHLQGTRYPPRGPDLGQETCRDRVRCFSVMLPVFFSASFDCPGPPARSASPRPRHPGSDRDRFRRLAGSPTKSVRKILTGSAIFCNAA